MKRMLLFAALLLAAAACTQTPEPNAPGANANAATTPKAEATVADADVIAKEKAIWDTIKNKNYDGFAAMLADDAIEVSDNGVYDKAGIVKNVKTFEPTEITFSDWKVTKIDKDAAVVSYTVSVKGNSNGKPLPPNTTARGSSAWLNRGGKWLAVYHQETTPEQMPAPATSPTPAKAATPAPKSSASPTPAAIVTSADVEANEKAVWDAFKHKNYDAFASIVADDATEVESTGVYDKAGIVKGVQMFDATGTTLSDFKVVKFDADAALVTSLVKGPVKVSGPEGERHTTIWANRNGKWMAVFHQGTRAVKPTAMPAPSAK
ncbi:MAG: DUF4440 domain-containing protein [Pyrinomonadaceae bacterium]